MVDSLEKSQVIPNEPIWRLSVEQYHEMIQRGILTADDAVELLEGWLITKMSKKRSHTLVTQRIRQTLEQLVPSGWYVEAQEPITTADSEPEPDITIIRGKRDDYLEQQPHSENVTLVIEVSDATLQRDRSLKLRIYANARIPVYWIVNLQERQIEVYTEAAGEDEQAQYQQQKIYQEVDSVPLIIAEKEVGTIKVADILP